MSEKQVKRARFAAKHGCDKILIIGGQRWLQADEQAKFMAAPVREVPDPIVGALSCGKTFCCAGLGLNDSNEVVVVNGRRLAGLE